LKQPVMTSILKYEVDDAIATITFNRPQARNVADPVLSSVESAKP
jgi:enoyl-CoA hydratase/carnithine racemase